MKIKRAAVCAAVAAAAAAILTFRGASREIASLSGLCALGGGETLAATEERGATRFEIIDAKGHVRRQYRRARRQNGQDVALVGLTADAEGLVYAIEDRFSPQDGALLGQELAVYAPGRVFGREMARVALDSSGGARYRWLSVTGSLILMGTDENESVVLRAALDLDSLREEERVTVKSLRRCPARPGEGVYVAVGLGRQAAYLSRSGKAFLAAEGEEARELYPARVLERLMAPLFLAPNAGESLLLGELDSGDLLALALDGETHLLRGGAETFPGTSCKPADFVYVSMRDAQTYTGVVRSEAGARYELVAAAGGTFSQIGRIRRGAAANAWFFLSRWAAFTALLLAAVAAVRAAARAIDGGRSVRRKLLAAAGMLLLAADAAFVLVSCAAYRATALEGIGRQAAQEGALLAQALDPRDWAAVEYPYDYGGEAYRRLRAGLEERETAARAAYYEDGALYTVVGDGPCFYPLDILLNAPLAELCRAAALTGRVQTGLVADARGERIACVTPVGGHAGDAVCLVETGAPGNGAGALVRAYGARVALVSSLFCGAAFILFAAACARFLEPVGRIRAGLCAYVGGERPARLSPSTGDEFADICRVFNQLADDIDARLYTLHSMEETYGRFVPRGVPRLLGKDSVGALGLGAHVRGPFSILSVRLFLPEMLHDPEGMQELTGRFFSIVDGAAEEGGALLLSDRLSLRELRILCPDGNAAVRLALATIAKLDSHNADAARAGDPALEVTFLLHLADAWFGICGDEGRYLPAVFSRELEQAGELSARFGMLADRLLVTSRAYEAIDPSPYYNRFIGCLGEDSKNGMGLYDFYDGASVRATRLLNDTRNAFDRAMELYRQGRYYDAKNLFAAVLRENQSDSVARYYVFSCEKRMTGGEGVEPD